MMRVEVLVGKLQRKRPLGRPRHRWEANIKLVLQGVECECMDWFNGARDRDGWQSLGNTVMNIRVP